MGSVARSRYLPSRRSLVLDGDGVDAYQPAWCDVQVAVQDALGDPKSSDELSRSNRPNVLPAGRARAEPPGSGRWLLCSLAV